MAHVLTCGQVHKVMGLKEPGAFDSGLDTFSDDGLKIEICGPDQQHLSVKVEMKRQEDCLLT